MTLSRSPLLLPLLLVSGCLHAQPLNEDRLFYETEQCARKLTEGDCTQAMVHCNLGLEFAPQSADLWNNKGLIADRCLRDEKQAKEDFIKAIRFNQEHASAYTNLGVLYMREGDDKRAEDSFLRALKVNPDIVEARYNLAFCYTHMRQWEQAKMAYLTLLTVEPGNGRNHHDLGTVYVQLGSLSEAEQSLLTAVSLQPSASAEWWNDLGTIQMKLGHVSDALESFRSCLSINPDHPLCASNLRIALEQQKLDDAAPRKRVVQPAPGHNDKAFTEQPGPAR